MFFLFMITYTSTSYTKLKKNEDIYKTIHTKTKPYCLLTVKSELTILRTIIMVKFNNKLK